MELTSLLEKNKRIHKLINLIETIQEKNNYNLSNIDLYKITKQNYNNNYFNKKEYELALQLVNVKKDGKNNTQDNN